jgi:hypothetical protein
MTAPDVERAIDDLKVVRDMIERTRKATMESGILFIWWGFLSLVAIGLHYVFLAKDWLAQIGFIWSVFLIVGYVGTYLHLRKKHRSGVKSFIDRLIGTTWCACGISIILLTFVAPGLDVYGWNYVPPMVTIILAVGVFITGMLYEWRSLSYIAFLWWAGAIFMFIYQDANLLIMGGLIGGVMIAIGFAARTRFHRELAHGSNDS